MSTNCLVNKLKGSVDNGSLLKVGEIQISHIGTPYEGSRFQVVIGNTNIYMNVKSGKVYIQSTGQEVSSPYQLSRNNYNNFTFDNNGSKFTLDNKYGITQINDGTTICYLNIDDLKYCSSLTYLAITGDHTSGNVGSLKELQLTYLQLSGPELIGDISAIGEITSLTRLILVKTNVSGNINSLRNLTSLNQNCNLSYNDLLEGDVSELGYWTGMTGKNINITGTNITGTIESFAQKLVANSAADGTYTIISAGANVTYNGVKVNYSAIVTISGSDYSISVS